MCVGSGSRDRQGEQQRLRRLTRGDRASGLVQLSTVNSSWIRLNPSRQTPQSSEMVLAMGSPREPPF